MKLEIKYWIRTSLWIGFALLVATSSSYAESGRNPFALPKGVYYKQDKKPTQTSNEKIKETPKNQVAQLPPLSLEAVILGGPRRVAVINNQNYVVGETIFGHELVEIGRDQAVLMGPYGSVELNLEAAPFGLKVSGR